MEKHTTHRRGQPQLFSLSGAMSGISQDRAKLVKQERKREEQVEATVQPFLSGTKHTKAWRSGFTCVEFNTPTRLRPQASMSRGGVETHDVLRVKPLFTDMLRT